MTEKREYDIKTKLVHSGYKAAKGEPQVLPIVQNTTYRYYNTEDVADLFDLKTGDFMYSRLGSPTPSALEVKMADLEGGKAAVATSSGQSATLTAILNIAQAGDNIIASKAIYGGTYNLLGVTMKKMGIDVTFVDQDLPLEQLVSLGKENTKAIFAETLANPTLKILDLEKFVQLGEALQVPLIVDNTLATPCLCRPIEYGANIVIHSTTKWADGHGTSVGGMVIDGGNFDWSKNSKFPGMVEADDSYHGLSFFKSFGEVSFAVKLRAQLLRDLGCAMAPMNGFLTFQGLSTLALRMERHSSNALQLSQHLEGHPLVAWVKYPGLEKDEEHSRLKKYFYNEAGGGVLSFGVKGGKEAGSKFIEALELSSLVVHVGDIRTSVLHPSSTTHRQLSEEEQVSAGIKPELIRVSVGCEAIEDIIEDFDRALEAI